MLCSLTLRLWFGLVVLAEDAEHNAQNNNDQECHVSASNEACFDDNASICFERRLECDSDPSYMLVHCRETCQVCHSGTLSQDAGFDSRIPVGVSIQVLQVARQTNLYYQSLNIPDHTLISCHDQSNMCAFWKFQGQCTSRDYRDYMERECPLTCQLCELVQARAFVKFLLQDLQEAYDTHSNDVFASRKASLSLLMTRLGMNPALIAKPLDNYTDANWAEELHSRLHGVIPSALLRIYDSLDGTIGAQDLVLLTELHGFPPDTSRGVVLTRSLVQYRSRGYIVSIMQAVEHLITRPIQLLIGFAVPTDAAIQRLKRLSPLLQMGAGSGYFASTLRQQDVHVLAYDLHPPSTQNNKNEFFDAAYVNDIQEGACVESMTPELASNRTLLLVWPNDPDPIDNTVFCQDDACQGSQAIWDADCLEAFVKAGGRRVVFVGERAAVISGNGSDSGMSATRRFQSLLENDFVLIDTIKIPNWWLNEDDMTIWEKK